MSLENQDHKSIDRETADNAERDLGPRIIDRVRQAVNERWQEIDSEHRVDAFTSLYLRPRTKCVPDWFIGDDIMDAIIDLYYEPLAAVRDELADSKPMWPGDISVCVMPSRESETTSVVFARERLLFRLSQKAWTFWWKSEEDMAEELAQWYAAAEQGLTQESALSERHRHALREVLGQIAVLLPGKERVRVIDQDRLKAAVEDLRGLI